MGDESWAQRRREAAGEHAEMLQRRRRGEHDKAAALLAGFVRAATTAGLRPERLRVQDYGGRATARSDRDGWYLRGDRTVAVGTDGKFYVLTANVSFAERLRGVTLLPQEPPMVIGAGGKDGDSIDLPEALERVLPGWSQLAG